MKKFDIYLDSGSVIRVEAEDVKITYLASTGETTKWTVAGMKHPEKVFHIRPNAIIAVVEV